MTCTLVATEFLLIVITVIRSSHSVESSYKDSITVTFYNRITAYYNRIVIPNMITVTGDHCIISN